jgi:molybdopterin converting factor small subunit
MYIEFLGIPRERAVVSEIEVDAASLGQALTQAAVCLPRLSDLIDGDRLHPSLAANLNGDRFVRDPATPLAAGDRLLLMSADAGG